MAKRPTSKLKSKGKPRRSVGEDGKPARKPRRSLGEGGSRKGSVVDRLVELSIAAGDPLQPAGLPSAEATAKTARAAALKSAHARFKNRPKPQK